MGVIAHSGGLGRLADAAFAFVSPGLDRYNRGFDRLGESFPRLIKESTRCRSIFPPGMVISATRPRRIKEKLEKLARLYDRLSAIEVRWIWSIARRPNVDLRVSAKHKHDFVAVSRWMELMASIDEVVEKMEQQLRKYKEKVQDRHRGRALVRRSRRGSDPSNP